MNGYWGSFPYGFGPGWGGMPGWGNIPSGPWQGMGWSPWWPPFGGAILDDAEIASYVRDNIDLDPYIPVNDKNNIDVDVQGGIVTLSGKVKNRRSKGLAFADAFWTVGVLDVINNIEVEEMKPASSKKATE